MQINYSNQIISYCCHGIILHVVALDIYQAVLSWFVFRYALLDCIRIRPASYYGRWSCIELLLHHIVDYCMFVFPISCYSMFCHIALYYVLQNVFLHCAVVFFLLYQ